MISIEQARTLQGKTMHGAGGEKLGKIDTLYADRDGGEPTFATVHTGAFGTKTSFVPLNEATMAADGVEVPYTKDQVHSAPKIDPDAELEPAEEQRLYQHYGVSGYGDGQGYDSTTTTGRTETAGMTTGSAGRNETEGLTAAGGTAGIDSTTSRSQTSSTSGTRDYDESNQHGTVGRDTSGPTTDDAMTRSEERVQVGTEQTEAGRARLRKYIVSETETRTVPVSHEEVRVEREPITDANRGAAYDGPELSEEEHEVVLHAEKPVVAKETVPVERVRLDTETVTEQQTVSADVRKEQIETDGGVYPEGDTTRGGAREESTTRGGGVDGDPTTRR